MTAPPLPAVSPSCTRAASAEASSFNRPRPLSWPSGLGHAGGHLAGQRAHRVGNHLRGLCGLARQAVHGIRHHGKAPPRLPLPARASILALIASMFTSRAMSMMRSFEACAARVAASIRPSCALAPATHTQNLAARLHRPGQLRGGILQHFHQLADHLRQPVRRLHHRGRGPRDPPRAFARLGQAGDLPGRGAIHALKKPGDIDDVVPSRIVAFDTSSRMKPAAPGFGPEPGPATASAGCRSKAGAWRDMMLLTPDEAPSSCAGVPFGGVNAAGAMRPTARSASARSGGSAPGPLRCRRWRRGGIRQSRWPPAVPAGSLAHPA